MNKLIACPNPLGISNKTLTVHGNTVAAMLRDARHQIRLQGSLRVFVNDILIPEDRWDLIRPDKGDIISVRAIPAGGGNGEKNPMRTILTIAVMAGAMYITGGAAAGAFGASFGAGTMGAALLGVGVAYAGSMLVDAIAPMPKPAVSSAADNPDPQTFGIESARNALKPYGSIPMVLGRHRVAPPYAAAPYTEIDGGDQYLRMLFCVGYGPLSLTDMRIGETSIDEFAGDGGTERVEHYIYEEFDPAADTLKLYPGDVKENALSILLKEVDSWSTRTTEPDTDEISIDVLAPKGMVRFNDAGTKLFHQIEYEIQYAPTGTSDWSIGRAGKVFGARQIYTDPHSPRTSQTCIPVEGGGCIAALGSAYFGERWDRVGIHKETGELVYLKGNPITSAGGTGKLPPYPSYVAPLCRVYLPLNNNGVGQNLIYFADERNEELLSSAAGDFEPSLTDPSPGVREITIAAGTLYSQHLMYGKTTATVRDTARFSVPKGQYDVRVRRVTADATDDGKTFDEIHWAMLRSFNHDVAPVNIAGLTLVEMRIKATDQLNGVIDNFNVVATSRIPAWDPVGMTWTEMETNNPAALARYVLQGAANKRAITDSRLDLDSFQEFAEYCLEESLSFNQPIDAQKSVWEALVDILAAGRASLTYRDGKHAIAIDNLKTTPTQVFSPRNSWGFSAEKRFYKIPHAFRVRFPNEEKDWRVDERVVYADGYTDANAVEFEELQLPGITNANLAYRLARFHLAQLKLRPESYNWNVDMEHLVCTRGDLVRLQHDVLVVGLAAGRVKSRTDNGTNVLTITVDEPLTMIAGTSYGITARLGDGSIYSGQVETAPGDHTTLTFVSPPLIAVAPDVGDLVTMGEFGEDSIDVLITRIEPADDLVASIAAVPYSAALYDLGFDDVPDFASNINIPAGLLQPAISQIRSDESVQTFGPSGEFFPRMVIDIVAASAANYLDIDFIEGQYKPTQDTNWLAIAPLAKDISQFIITPVEEGEAYNLRLRYRYRDGRVSPWTEVTHQVVGSSSFPSDVAGFIGVLNQEQLTLSWDPVTDRDLSHYEIRFTSETVAVTWDIAMPVIDRVSKFQDNYTTLFRSGTYFIKAVDYGGRKSTNAAVITTVDAEIAGLNLIQLLQEDPDFIGTHSDTVVITSNLELDNSSGLMSSITLMSDVDSLRLLGDISTEGTYTFNDSLDLGAKYQFKIIAAIKAVGIDYADIMSDWILMSDVELMSNSAVGQWSYELQVRTTNDDPTGTPTWSEWTPIILGDYIARAAQFRIILRSNQPNVTPRVSELRVRVEMVDRVVGQEDIVSSAGGSAITFTNAFYAQPAIAISADNGQTGDYVEITSKSRTGFTVTFKNSVGTGVSRQFDYIAKGYGKQLA